MTQAWPKGGLGWDLDIEVAWDMDVSVFVPNQIRQVSLLPATEEGAKRQRGLDPRGRTKLATRWRT